MSEEKNSMSEMTVKAVVLGVILSVILAGANAYLGMFAGMTVSATIPASVISMGVLSLLFKRHTIFENTQVMTCASAGEALAAGAVFTIPALVIMGASGWEKGFDYWQVVLICGFGGVLGVLFTVPLRRALIVEGDLQFPEGIATAEVLKSGQTGGSAIKAIALSAIGGALFKIGATGLYLWHDVFQVAARVKLGAKTTVAYFGSNLSPALLSVGYIVGLNIAILIFIGGAGNWLVTLPICAACDIPVVYKEEGKKDRKIDSETLTVVDEEGNVVKDEKGKVIKITDLEYAEKIWAQHTRYVGVGAMVLGGLWAVIKMWRNIVAGIKSGLSAYKQSGGGEASIRIPRTERDIPMKWVLTLIIFSVVPLFFLYNAAVGKLAVSAPMAIVMLIFGFLFSAVAGYMAGLVGSSNNPVSGVTVATVLLSALLLVLLLGKGAANGPIAAVIIGAVICCAASIAGDNLQDLKSGYLVKATPWKQEVMLIIGVIAAALVLAPILNMLMKAYGFKGHWSATDKALSLPQANLMEAVSTGVFKGGLPWAFFFGGIGMALGLIILDEILRRKGSSFRTPVLAVAIGFYLPFELSVPILAGGILRLLINRYQKRKQMTEEQKKSAEQTGLLFASGLITGEALIGILLAIPIIIFKDKRALALISKDTFVRYGAWMAIPGIILLCLVAVWFYYTARKPKETS
jgi:OPT family oligopeptide transporter